MPYENRLVTQGDSGAEMGRGSHNGTTGIQGRDAHVLRRGNHRTHEVDSADSLLILLKTEYVFPSTAALSGPSADSLLDGIDPVSSQFTMLAQF